MDTEVTLKLAEGVVNAWEDWVTETERPEPHRLDVRLARLEDLVPIVVGLRVKRLGYLGAITGLDPQGGEQDLEVLYHFMDGAAIITLRVQVPRENAAIPTLSGVIPAAEPYERELSEMFGVTIQGIRNPDRLYLPEDWPADVYPLRKDFDPAALSAGTEKEMTS
jgi:NADH-quinone oxidoreductase subunit C